MSTTANLGMTLPAGTDWADIAVLNANFELIDAAMGAARAAEPYSAAKTYAVGDYCTRDGALFKCTVAITAPETWTAGHWKATSIGAEFKAIYAALEGKAAANHTHTAQDVGAASAIHTHDDRYYTEAEVVALLAGKQDLSTAINTGNIANQSVNYANSAGAANTVGGYSAAQLIAAAAAAGAKVEKISYVGTGTAGPSDPTVLAFTKLPKIVFLFDNYQTCILAKVKPNSYSDERWIVVSNCYYFNSTAHLGYGVGVTEDGTTLKISYGNSTYSYASQCQGNLQGTTYSAIGIS